MEFSLIFEGQAAPPTREQERAVLLEGIEQAILADELGFDRWYNVEHHTLNSYAHSSAPEVFLSYVAAKTRRIRVAHGVVCLPFKMNHPVRVAERTATLDILSGGRLDVGVGRSSSVREQETFGIRPEDTQPELEDALRAIVKFWTEDETDYHSQILDVPLRTVRPRPLQDPHPPLAMACTRDNTFEFAGKHGIAVLSNGVDGPNQARRKREMYDTARAARSPSDVIGKFANDKFGASVFATVLPDRDEARRVGLRGLRFFMEAAKYFFAGGPPPNPDAYRDEDTVGVLMEMIHGKMDAKGLAAEAPDPNAIIAAKEHGVQGVGFATAVGSNVENPFAQIDFGDRATTAFGDANDTIEFIEGMRDAGVDEVFFNVQMGGIPQEAVMETISQIGKNVIPHFRKPAPTVFSMSDAV
jgi:alkanesulfonate monooxygenase SsuD/methylene tetrahydromethanopterin reductase-like flavin-dependent oxidoreductase (luciferase family)